MVCGRMLAERFANRERVPITNPIPGSNLRRVLHARVGWEPVPEGGETPSQEINRSLGPSPFAGGSGTPEKAAHFLREAVVEHRGIAIGRDERRP
jgi:hypothetical protein